MLVPQHRLCLLTMRRVEGHGARGSGRSSGQQIAHLQQSRQGQGQEGQKVRPMSGRRGCSHLWCLACPVTKPQGSGAGKGARGGEGHVIMNKWHLPKGPGVPVPPPCPPAVCLPRPEATPSTRPPWGVFTWASFHIPFSTVSPGPGPTPLLPGPALVL